MVNKTVILMFSVLLVCQVAIAACTHAPAVEDAPVNENAQRQVALLKSFVCRDEECENSIIIGVTTFDEAKAFLEEQYGTDGVKVDERFQSIEWETNSPHNSVSGGSLRTNNQDIVDEVRVFFSDTVAEMIDQIGEPASVYVVRAFSSEALCAGAFVRYPDIGINAFLRPVDNSIGIRSNQFVSSLEFMTLKKAEDWTITDTWIVEWEGFRDYCDVVATKETQTPRLW